MTEGTAEEAVLNINVGILGHVDSGKTSLARALSQTASTAAFDRNPQSQARGITLDLGFSSVRVPLPGRFEAAARAAAGDGGRPAAWLQLTFVDCPGHASLIRTILGGAQIMDMMLLVVDAVKGIQTQTGEGIVIGEITTDRMVIALNKVDALLPADQASALVDKAAARVRAAMRKTRFADAPLVAVAADVGAAGTGADAPPKTRNLDALVAALVEAAPVPVRVRDGPFVMAVDHAFPIRGQGTVMTGTVLSGVVEVNQSVEVAGSGVQRKVKSIQRFRQPVRAAAQGDRIGLCVTQFDAATLERGIVCSPGAVPAWSGCICPLRRIAYYKQPVTGKGKYHITIGHQTVMASLRLFGREEAAQEITAASLDDLRKGEFVSREELNPDGPGRPAGSQWAVLHFETPVLAPPGALLIGARLDMDIHSPTCRIAFFGRLAIPFDPTAGDYPVRVFKWKEKTGTVVRVAPGDPETVIARGFFTRAASFAFYQGQSVALEGDAAARAGVIDSTFGQGDKVKVRFRESVADLTPGTKLTLRFKKYARHKPVKNASTITGCKK